jgi:cyclic-di-GMP-binding protein
MPSFDLVSKIDISEFKNAVNQAQREISTRYDFKGSKAAIELFENHVEIKAEDEYKMNATLDILRSKMAKRGVSMNALEPGDIKPHGNMMFKQVLDMKQGIDKEKAKKINKFIKNSGKKVSSQYLDEKIRITGKKIDDLQGIFQELRISDEIGLDLSMENMK